MLKYTGSIRTLEDLGFRKLAGNYIFGDETDQCLFIEADNSVGIYCTTSQIDLDVEDRLLEKLYYLIKANLIIRGED